MYINQRKSRFFSNEHLPLDIYDYEQNVPHLQILWTIYICIYVSSYVRYWAASKVIDTAKGQLDWVHDCLSSLMDCKAIWLWLNLSVNCLFIYLKAILNLLLYCYSIYWIFSLKEIQHQKINGTAVVLVSTWVARLNMHYAAKMKSNPLNSAYLGIIQN